MDVDNISILPSFLPSILPSLPLLSFLLFLILYIKYLLCALSYVRHGSAVLKKTETVFAIIGLIF